MAKQIVLGESKTLVTSDEHLNFPFSYELRDGRRYLNVGQGFHAVTERKLTFRSDDDGKTWVMSRDPFPAFEFEDGTLLSLGRNLYPGGYSVDPAYFGDPKVWLMGVMRSTDGGENWEKGLSPISFPFVFSSCHAISGHALLPDGTLLQVCVAPPKGENRCIAMVVATKDKGRTWEFRGTSGGPETQRHYGEVGLEYHPPSGDLVTLFRVGGPLYGARSSDLGYTWTEPEIILDEWFEYIQPFIIGLDDGTLVATYGTRHPNLEGKGIRPGGSWVMHSEDGGHTWEEPVRVWDGPSCNYTTLWRAGGQRFRIFHSKSGFCHMEIERKGNTIHAIDAEVQ